MTISDQRLLADFRAGRPDAFRELVERHGGLVYGVAWRVTRDRMLAEEAAQDVFCLLARKSAGLAAHPAVAGWLHRTAINVARDLARRRAGHERKLARFAAESAEEGPDGRGSSDWEVVDAAIDRLPADERAVVVLRFFEDLDHAAIAGRLQITEAAARKRLSRGLARLQKVVALPARSLAVVPPAATLAQIEAVRPAAETASGVFEFFSLMTHKQLTAALALSLAGGGLLWFGGSQWRENQRLNAELAFRREHRPMAAGEVTTPGLASGDRGAAAGTADVTAALRAELAAEVEKRRQIEAELAALRSQTEPLRDQVVVAFGKVQEIGNTLGSLFAEARALVELEKAGSLDTPENGVRMAKFMQKASSIAGLSKEIVEFEDNPDEGSQFVAAAYGEVFGLDDTETARVAEWFTGALEEAKARKFTLSNLPEHGSEEFEPWLEQRWAFFNERRDDLRTILPEAKRADFDQWIEKGGYGFKNLTMKGMPLMFSLGGDPR